MNDLKEIDIQNGTYYLFDDMISIGNLDANKTKIDKNLCIHVFIYFIRYMRINCTKPFYLRINKINGCIEESNVIQYMKIAPADESKNALKDFWSRIRDLIRTKSNCLHNS